MARRRTANEQDDLFSIDPTDQAMHALDSNAWPAAHRVPVNRAGANVRAHVWADLLASGAVGRSK
jgi:hypothetical protein